MLSRLERGKAIRTDALFRVLHDLGLAVRIEPVDGENAALAVGRQGIGQHEVTNGPAPSTDRPSLPDHELPIFAAFQLRITPRRTSDDIRRAVAEGRFAEMTSGLAGYDDDEN